MSFLDGLSKMGSDLMGSKLGGALGAVGDMVQKAVGEIAPFFESEAAANEDLMNKQPKWLDAKDPKSVGLDDKTGKKYPSMTHIRNFVRAEFLRREQNFGNYYPPGGEFASYQISGGTADAAYFNYDAGHGRGRQAEMFLSDDYVGCTYKGPKSAWTRVVSNTMKDGFEGFVLHGVDNFEDMYGFNPDLGTDGQSVMGYDTKKKPHIMEEPDFKHRPSPGITGIECEDLGPTKAQKKTTIKFTVWSRAQLDYISPYFCTPGNTVLVEWGWNTFPRSALIDLTEENSPPSTVEGHHAKLFLDQINRVRASHPDRELDPLKEDDIDPGMTYIYKEGTGQTGLWNSISKTKEQLRNGQGNYSFVLGMITNWSTNLRDDGGYDVTIESLSMSGIAQSLNKKSTKNEKKNEREEKPKHRLDLENFITGYLDEMVREGDEDPNDWPWGDDGYSSTSIRDKANTLTSHGRYFSFGHTPHALGTDDNKQYMAGSPSDGCYITLGWLIDIINVFFGKESVGTEAKMFEFDIEGERCVAHPNIKSTDGSVLLIPNAMAPRHNLGQFDGTTIGLAGESGDPGYFSSAQETDDDVQNTSKSFTKLVSGVENSARDAFIAMVEATEGLAPGTLGDGAVGLKKAMHKSPRDDIHRLMTLHPHIDGDDRGSDFQTGKFRVDPFPDYLSDDYNQTGGYSGRIKDLFVEMKVVKDAVENNQTATSILKTILKKMSTAAGDIWDFDLVGKYPDNPNNTVLTIKDRKFSSNTVDEEQRSDKTFIFKAHQKNSIVRSLSCDVSIPGEIAGMVLFGGKGGDADSAFYARKDEDMVLKTAKVIDPSGETLEKHNASSQASKEYPNEESYIMGIYVWDGASNVLADIEGGGGYARGMSDGNANLSTGDDDEPVIDIEFVDPSKNRMLELMTQDKNPKNCVKYNMALDGIELSMQLDGIEGIRLWDVFSCTGVPTKYYMNGLWRVTNIKHSVSGTDWTTDITAQFAPNSADSMKEDN